MALMSPVFREINYARMKALSEAGHSSRTIASVMNDITDNKFGFSARDVEGYLKTNKTASNQMLISKPALDSFDPSSVQPT